MFFNLRFIRYNILQAEYAFRKKKMNFPAVFWQNLWIDPHRYDWLLVEKTFCTERYPEVKTLIIVHTATKHFSHRNVLRQMYGDQFYSKV